MNNGKPFEASVKKMLEKFGFTITRLPRPSADGGVDMIATYPSPVGETRWVIQCKDTASVNRRIVDELHGTLYREQGNIGLLITSGRFTRDAQQAAKNHRYIKLIDGPKHQRLTTPPHIRKTIPDDHRQITRATIEGFNKIIEEEPTSIHITVATTTKLPKHLKKLANKSGSLRLNTTYIKPRKAERDNVQAADQDPPSHPNQTRRFL